MANIEKIIDTLRNRANNSEVIRRLLRKSIYPYNASLQTPKPFRNHQDKHLFIACFPKSGSTYITSLLSEVTKIPKITGVIQFIAHNELDIYEFRLREALRKGSFIAQQHTKGTINNVMLLKKYDIKPVVLTRNIYDVVISLHDHIEKFKDHWQTGYIHKDYYTLNFEDKISYLIYIHLPWYFNFLVSWHESSLNISTLWITYEDFFADQITGVKYILDYYNIELSDDKINDSLESMQTKIAKPSRENTLLSQRNNVGKAGRGAMLSFAHKNAIENLASVWKIDDKLWEIINI